MKVAIVNLGCRVNRVESDTIAQAYLARGGELVDIGHADAVIVNTCTVTGEAEKKTRKAIRRALKANDHADVLVTGCAAAIDPEGYAALSPRITIVDKADLLDTDALAPRVGEQFPSRVGIKVQDGCNHACTYCIVHVARGRAWSRPAEELVAEVRMLEAAGAREIVLTGIDLGSYHHGGTSLAELLSLLLASTSQVRFRISSIEPCSIKPALIELMATSKGRICQHLHLPLQSGSSKVLQEMNRPYDAAFFTQLVARLREAMPDISLTTDIIVGFPGETEEDFAQTLSVAKESLFSKIHVFRYSKRAGTPAAVRTDQVPPEVAERRAKELQALSDELRLTFGRRFVGTTQDVAVEGEGFGMTGSFYRVRLPEDLPHEKLASLRLTSLDASGIFDAC